MDRGSHFHPRVSSQHLKGHIKGLIGDDRGRIDLSSSADGVDVSIFIPMLRSHLAVGLVSSTQVVQLVAREGSLNG